MSRQRISQALPARTLGVAGRAGRRRGRFHGHGGEGDLGWRLPLLLQETMGKPMGKWTLNGMKFGEI